MYHVTLVSHRGEQGAGPVRSTCLGSEARDSEAPRATVGVVYSLETVSARYLHWLSGKESACNAEPTDLIPGSGRSSREGNGIPLQCSCLENPIP